jgi:hypothetical protein
MNEPTTGTRVVSALPATGWQATFDDGLTLDVIAWAIQEDGDAYGLVVSGNAVLPAFAVGDPDRFVEYSRK